MIGGTERKQILAYDRVCKTRAWKGLLIVNPKGNAEVNGLLDFCRQLQITLVWDLDPGPASPTERARRAAVLARLQVTERANPRLRVLVGPPFEVAAVLAREQELFSGAILAQLEYERPLAPQLRAWAALCAPDGTLIGKHHTDLKFRAELSAVSALWRPWPHGLWLLDVRHVARETIPAVDEPILQESSVKNLAEDLPSFSATGPIKPPVGKRTRPVWETLERNLGNHPVALQRAVS